MSNLLPQEPLTTWLVGYLRDRMPDGSDNAVLIGDGIAPEAGGWSGGQPGEGEFVPYVTVAGGDARPGIPDAMGGRFADWTVVYRLQGTGASRRQVDWLGDRVTELLTATKQLKINLNEDVWKIIDVRVPQMGAPLRTDTTDPPYWEAADSVELWVSRSK